ncbi:MAG: nucleotidyltransferase domain-containing protein [Candidatus Adiutrix sp.]|nr:nucleotidyltransferase domain-containing protein [Candidatus Adiutrix sp.]
MIEVQKWMDAALAGLREKFGGRLLYLGLQGSYRRGEATEDSDIDLVCLLEQVTLDDLDAYRTVVRGLPEGEKACGFMGGKADLAAWPRQELFQFKMDTADHYGQLETFLPPVSREDIIRGVRVGASTLLHIMTHSYLYADPEARPAILKDGFKAAFFTVQAATYLRTGAYYSRKQQLLENLGGGSEKEIIFASLNCPVWLAAHSEQEAFELLLEWGRIMLTWPFQ